MPACSKLTFLSDIRELRNGRTGISRRILTATDPEVPPRIAAFEAAFHDLGWSRRAIHMDSTSPPMTASPWSRLLMHREPPLRQPQHI
jgi:hypothetical protein